MADILDLGSGSSRGAKHNARQPSGPKGSAADIIIFPGVRYERDENPSGDIGAKMPVAKKKKAKSTSSD